MRGRKPKPDQVHVNNGNPSRKKLNDRAPAPTIKGIAPPSWMKDDATLAVWRVICKVLADMGVMTVADVESVGRYCDGIVLWQRARNHLHQYGSTYPIRAKDPVVTTDADGKQQTVYPITSIAQYPQVAEYRQLSKLLLAFEAEFGLTASARTRIEVAELPKDADDPSDAARRSFFAQGKGRATLAG